MAKDKLPTDDMMAMWAEGQKQFLAAQKQAVAAFEAAMGSANPFSAAPSSGLGKPKVETPDFAAEQTDYAMEMFDLSVEQFSSWMKFAERYTSAPQTGPAAATLAHMLDPMAWLNTGIDEVNSTLRRMVEGPEFSDSWEGMKAFMQTSQEWLDLRKATAAYSQVVGSAWMRAYQQFMEQGNGQFDPAKLSQTGFKSMMQQWLNFANAELLKTQRSNPFLEAQRDVLRASLRFRNRERELVEMFSEAHSIPTRTEVDDLTKMVHDLRREVRDLKRALQTANARADVAEATIAASAAPKPAAPKPAPRKAGTRTRTTTPKA